MTFIFGCFNDILVTLPISLFLTGKNDPDNWINQVLVDHFNALSQHYQGLLLTVHQKHQQGHRAKG